VVIDDLNVIGIAFAPTEANSVLIIDTYAVLPLPASSEFFEPVPRRSSQIAEVDRCVQ
jgi:hypothetical protein